jgi:hypothetical protein
MQRSQALRAGFPADTSRDAGTGVGATGSRSGAGSHSRSRAPQPQPQQYYYARVPAAASGVPADYYYEDEQQHAALAPSPALSGLDTLDEDGWSGHSDYVDLSRRPQHDQ